MLYLYLTRHGETIWNTQSRMQGRLDSPLTAKGLEQADSLARQLQAVPLDLIITSPAQRALSTAGRILETRPTPVPVRIDDRIHEMDLGGWEGWSVSEAETADPANLHAFLYEPQSFVPVGQGESFSQVSARMASFLADLETAAQESQASGKDQYWLVISHNITLKALLALMYERPLAMLRDGPPIPQASLYRAWRDGHWTVDNVPAVVK
jgi:probable phosphoglycerate mutase